MLSNYENILIKKETTEGTFVIPTDAYNISSISLNTDSPKQSIASINGKLLDPSRKVSWIKDVAWNLSFHAYNELLWLALTWAVWNASSVTNLGSWKYKHSFDVNEQWLPSYTVEVEKLAFVSRYSLLKFNTLWLSVDWNIFKIDKKTDDVIERDRPKYTSLSDFFCLKQIGMYRSNYVSVKQLAELFYILAFEYFNPDNFKVVLEINAYGNEFLAHLPHVFDGSNNYGSSIFFKTTW